MSPRAWLPREIGSGTSLRSHCQQAVEKYVKAILVRHQIEFRKTHDIERLLHILRGVEPSIADGLADARWLTPFGVDIRYPGDFPEALPGDETRALGLAQGAREAAMALLSPFLAEEDSAKGSGGRRHKER
jgi:HEPN domain-containing protein